MKEEFRKKGSFNLEGLREALIFDVTIGAAVTFF